MTAATFVTGAGKAALDARVMVRLAARGVARLGVAGFGRALKAYLGGSRNLLQGGPGRYVRAGGDVYAATAMPPLTDPAFTDLLLEEVVAATSGRPPPLLFGLLAVSSRCPYRCRHCYALDELRSEEAVPLPALERAVEDLGALGARSVFLTGGEPMARPEALPALVRVARRSGLRAWLVTSGWGATAETLAPLADAGLSGVVVSLDGMDRDTVAASKGHEGAFDHAVGALAAARDLGLVCSVDCMVTEPLLNETGFDAYQSFLAGLGVHFSNFFPAHPSGGAARHGAFGLDAGQMARLESLMDRNNRGASRRGWPVAYSAAVWEAPRGCVGGRQFVYVNPLGEVRACPFLPTPAGNIVDGSLRGIVARMRGDAAPAGCKDDLVAFSRKIRDLRAHRAGVVDLRPPPGQDRADPPAAGRP